MTKRLSNTVAIGGLAINVLSVKETVDLVFSKLLVGEGGWIVTANLHYLYLHRCCASFSEVLQRADLIVADGKPLIWLASLQGAALPQRVAGSDLTWLLAEDAAKYNKQIVLVGGEERTAGKAAKVLVARYDGLVIPGTNSFHVHEEPTQTEIEEVGTFVEATRADIVYVALGAPKQDKVIAALKDSYPQVWWIGVGGSLGFIAGETRRAPEWMQRLGIEWLHRLANEPKRLWKRYLCQDAYVFLHLLAAGMRRRWSGN